MTDITFDGWNILFQKTYDNDTESFYVKEANPGIDRVVQEKDTTRKRLYLFRPGFEPLWETGRCRGRLNVSKLIQASEFADYLRQFATSPAQLNKKIVGVYYGGKRQILRFWLASTASEADVATIKTELARSLNVSMVFEPFIDKDWKVIEQLSNVASNVFELRRSSSNSIATFKMVITYNDNLADARITKTIENAFTVYDYASAPLTNVNLALREHGVELTLYGNPDLRCDSFKKYDTIEFLVVLAAEWKHRIVYLLRNSLSDLKNLSVMVNVYRLIPDEQYLFKL